ncbi:uncharacterized protein MYCFIDRAFT_201172 [Pseudocercospora fijiensis CIRAD86]|uniref:Uncharacterized protein n=1 Tax=Pseudocercospora fijiensis (strain CIRAD86) TaxID=383855 RepID=N1Q9J0_PSEFD|nr:uncharacterized protein MYCFIDRAFT_201172 [Pseudocercospora fijiensis CIRAD86]EME87558.1 hypothetical protein MYCFIDRAFT_201172 [Pseudocercospora fijiensis CIRAD86]
MNGGELCPEVCRANPRLAARMASFVCKCGGVVQPLCQQSCQRLALCRASVPGDKERRMARKMTARQEK